MRARRHPPQSGDAITMTLTDEVDIARGDVLVSRRRARKSRTSSPRM